MSDREPIVIKQSFETSAEAVWKAITDASQMREWFFEMMEDFRAEVGFETQFTVEHDDRVFTHCWRVLEVEPNRRLKYGWCYQGYPGDSTATWELAETDHGTELTLTHTMIEAFPDDPVFSHESALDGWTYLIQESLKEFLESRDE